jgi:hypothetical protein
MSNIDLPSTRRTHRARRAPQDIPLPDGDKLTPRAKFAEEILAVSDRTAKRMNLPTVFIGGVAHIMHNASLLIVAGMAQRKNQPRKPRRTSAA